MLKDMRESILEINHTVVRSVGDILLIKEICQNICIHILERDLIVVRFVGNLFHNLVL